jgi:hypothetical protein
MIFEIIKRNGTLQNSGWEASSELDTWKTGKI